VGESRDLSDSNSAGEPRPDDEARGAENRDRKGSAAGKGRGTQNGDADHLANPSQHSQTVNSSNGNVPENPVYGALDLGTNNCRLLLARPTRRGFRVIDAFSRIIRLGEGVAQSGRLSDAAMRRTTDALRVCASKIERNGVHRARLVATEACRIAENGEEFLGRVQDRLGLDIEILTTETEARLAVSGCASLIDSRCDYVLVFDIGGGSSELIWLDLSRLTKGRGRTLDRLEAQNCMSAWTSLPVGVVTLAEYFGGKFVTEKLFEAMVDHVLDLLAPFEQQHRMQERLTSRSMHFLGTSGTVTTVAGIQLGLPRYDRNRVDGCWLSVADARAVTYDLVGQSYQERIAQPCIGRDRADLVLAGCAILEALIRMWPCERMRVADRGLREGILATLMLEDGVYRARRRSGRRRAR
jgi:exopolyphosphatase / guanosine-5'-triphosphate,3'-diphosphate pyrophosphatase